MRQDLRETQGRGVEPQRRGAHDRVGESPRGRESESHGRGEPLGRGEGRQGLEKTLDQEVPWGRGVGG